MRLAVKAVWQITARNTSAKSEGGR
jgi:hypothetical protein